MGLALFVVVACTAASLAQSPATPSTPLAIGETFTIQSKTLGEVRRINVYLPPQYSETATTRLPVLYMPDGGVAEDFIHVAGLVQVLTGNDGMRPFILVGIENTQRRRDLTGPTENAEDKKIAPKVGESASFRTFIRNELMPEIKSRYRTTSETAIIGESLAGLFVVETLLVEPKLFDTYIAFDPSVWWNDGALVKSAPAQLRALGTLKKTLYIALSRDDRGDTGKAFAAVLNQSAPASLAWTVEPMPQETHASIYHPAALQALRRLFAPPKAG